MTMPINVTGETETDVAYSLKNMREVGAVIGLVQALIQRGIEPKSMLVQAMYSF